MLLSTYLEQPHKRLPHPQPSSYHFKQCTAWGEVGAQGEMGEKIAREEGVVISSSPFPSPFAHLAPYRVFYEDDLRRDNITSVSPNLYIPDFDSLVGGCSD